MRILFSIALLGLLTSLSAQETITYPYNPDSDGDQFVGTSDVLSTLSTFDSEFEPSEIQIDDTNLSEIIIQMQEAIIALEAENASQAELITELQNSSGEGFPPLSPDGGFGMMVDVALPHFVSDLFYDPVYLPGSASDPFFDCMGAPSAAQCSNGISKATFLPGPNGHGNNLPHAVNRFSWLKTVIDMSEVFELCTQDQTVYIPMYYFCE